ncbi:MAG: DUF2393 domain-containing protein, partial [Helicobacter sp.]|nr:DUF2393 domain-containing protein [Helicobacter sp.]
IAEYFSLVDYLALVGRFLSILLLFLVSIAVRSNLTWAFLFGLLSVVLFLSAPFIYQWSMQTFIRKVDLALTYNDRLHYDTSYYVEGKLTNKGLLEFKGCIVSVNFIPKQANRLQRLKYEIRPFYEYLEVYKKDLKIGESLDFKIIIPSPHEEYDYVLNTIGNCY